MKRIMFYCQHLLGIGHLVRSTEIIRGLVQDTQVCFINGGEVIEECPVPPSVEVINLPTLGSDRNLQPFQVINASLYLEEVQEFRQQMLLESLDRFQPHILLIELFPFGRHYFAFELIPLLERAKARGIKIVCSLRDIASTQPNQQRYEEKVCQLIERYFDRLLIHGDPNFIRLEESFSRVSDLGCPIHYTGFVVQPLSDLMPLKHQKPLILVSVGGGRFSYDLLECVVKAASFLETLLPHHIRVFTGPFTSEAAVAKLQAQAAKQINVSVEHYTPQLLSYMQQADLSISLSGYNTTMNILRTGVRAMMMPLTGNGDREQTIRVRRLEQLGRVKEIQPEDLQPERLAHLMISCLQQQPPQLQFDFKGVERTSVYLHQLV